MRRTIRFLQDLNGLRATRKMGLTAAGVAFFGMFSLFPGLAALIAVFGILADPVVVQDQLALLVEVIPEDAFKILNGQLTALLGARTETLSYASLISLAVALWSARAGVAALIQGLNDIFEAPDRGGLRHIFVALLLTASLIGVAVVALLLIVIAPIALAFVPLGPLAAWALDITRYLVALGVLIVALGLVYRFGPNRRGQRLSWFTPGAVLVVVCWLATSVGFSVYLSNFGTYNEVYGSIGAVAALLMWFYLSAYLVLLGAAVNAVLARRKAERKGASADMAAAITAGEVPPADAAPDAAGAARPEPPEPGPPSDPARA